MDTFATVSGISHSPYLPISIIMAILVISFLKFSKTQNKPQVLTLVFLVLLTVGSLVLIFSGVQAKVDATSSSPDPGFGTLFLIVGCTAFIPLAIGTFLVAHSLKKK